MRATRTDKLLRDCLSVVGALSLRVIFAKGEIVPRSEQASSRLPFSCRGVVTSSDFASAKFYREVNKRLRDCLSVVGALSLRVILHQQNFTEK